MKKLITILFFINATIVSAQSVNSIMQEGNALYRLKEYKEAANNYNKITENNTYNKLDQSNALYNIGNSFAKQKNWDEALDYYTKSLMLNPNNADAKYNLSYVKQKIQKQEDKNKQDKKNNKESKQDKQKQDKQDQEKNKDDSKNQPKQKDKQQQQNKPQPNQDKQNKPQPQPSKLTKQQAEQYLNALKQEEKNLLQKKMKGKQANGAVGKDW